MKMSSVCLMILAGLWSGTTLAQGFEQKFEPHHYWGLGYSYLDGNVDLSSVGSSEFSFDNGLVGAIVGYRFDEYFALDFRGYGNVSYDEIGAADIKVKRSFSLLGRGILPFDKNVYFYGMLGIATSNASLSSSYGEVYDTDEDIQYGVGMSINKGGKLELQVEWLKVYDEDFVDISGINVNLVYNL